MDRQQFSSIAHRNHLYCNPISSEKIERLFPLLELTEESKIIDFGCGKAELILSLAKNYHVRADGVDHSPFMIKEAHEKMKTALPAKNLKVKFHQMTGQDFSGEQGGYDLAVCLGSTHVFGGYINTIRALKQWTRPGGKILIGEGYWKNKPNPEYLEFLNSKEEDLVSHANNVFLGREEGLIPLMAMTSSEDEWDEYEWKYYRSIEQYALENAQKSADDFQRDLADDLMKIRSWNSMYLKWGRSTLGFGLYLWQKFG